MKRSSSSSHSCCYPTCIANLDLGRPQLQTRYEVLKKFKFFILDVAKVCPNHLTVDAWVNVNQVAVIGNFSSAQINRVIEMLRDPKPSHDQNASTGKKCYQYFCSYYIISVVRNSYSKEDLYFQQLIEN